MIIIKQKLLLQNLNLYSRRTRFRSTKPWLTQLKIRQKSTKSYSTKTFHERSNHSSISCFPKLFARILFHLLSSGNPCQLRRENKVDINLRRNSMTFSFHSKSESSIRIRKYFLVHMKEFCMQIIRLRVWDWSVKPLIMLKVVLSYRCFVRFTKNHRPNGHWSYLLIYVYPVFKYEKSESCRKLVTSQFSHFIFLSEHRLTK